MCADIVEQGDEIISVGQLNQQAKKLLENQFRGVSVLGEISNIARFRHLRNAEALDEGTLHY